MSVPFWEETPPTWTPTSEEYYSRTDLVGSSALKDFRESRRLYEGRYVTGTVQHKNVTDAMTLGGLVDIYLTEPEEFDRQYAITDVRTRGAKAWMADEAANPGRELVKRDQADKAQKIAAEVLKNPIASGILTGQGISQVCHQWSDCGVPCRLRLDRVFLTKKGIPAMVDLKCWMNVHPIELAKDVYNRGTHRQLALYERGFDDLWGVKPAILLVVAHNVPPFEVVTYQIPQSFMALGRNDVAEDLAVLGKCLKTGDFSLPQETTITELKPPYWAR